MWTVEPINLFHCPDIWELLSKLEWFPFRPPNSSPGEPWYNGLITGVQIFLDAMCIRTALQALCRRGRGCANKKNYRRLIVTACLLAKSGVKGLFRQDICWVWYLNKLSNRAVYRGSRSVKRGSCGEYDYHSVLVHPYVNIMLINMVWNIGNLL